MQTFEVVYARGKQQARKVLVMVVAESKLHALIIYSARHSHGSYLAALVSLMSREELR